MLSSVFQRSIRENASTPPSPSTDRYASKCLRSERRKKSTVRTTKALELLSFGLYVLVSYDRYNPKSNEGGTKYILLGALSSAHVVH